MANQQVRPDPNLVTLNRNREVRYWMQVFSVSRSELEAAVLVVGTDATDIRRHLERQAFERLSAAELPARDRI
jgi:hypothetical protein